MTDLDALLHRVADAVARERADRQTRAVGPSATIDDLRATFTRPLPLRGTASAQVIDELATAADPGIIASTGPRYFGFVIGGSAPAALAADWLVSGWDNNSGLYACAPVGSVVEEVAGRWLVELFGLEAETSVGFTTGGLMANFSGLAAARHRVLADAGWDVEARGLQGAPPVRVVVGEERHATIDVALRYLGMGAENVEIVPADEQGRMHAERLNDTFDAGDRGPLIVCAQAGNVNTGACDDIAVVCDAAERRGAWVHVDGAFGLWAAVVDELRPLVRGIERAQSLATDAHKWLNVPYDCGIVLCADPEAHRGALGAHASYLMQGGEAAPYDPFEWVPEFSRRGRGIPVYAAMRALGREGIAEMVARTCACARRFAERFAGEEGVDVLNDVVLNQVLVRFSDSDDMTRLVIDAVQREGTCWLSGTVWHGIAAMRISVSNWQTTFEDVDASADAILRCWRQIVE